jgi:hypothetical protein
MRFCKSCGANLYAVRQAVATRDTPEKFDWSRTWIAEMLMSESEKKRRKEELDCQRGITPDVKRQKEIKAGVITASVGIGVTIFLYVFMRGIILGAKIPPDAAEILSRVWVAGVIPLFVGIGLMVSGIFVGRANAQPPTTASLEKEKQHASLSTGDGEPLLTPPFSVTDQTTRQLNEERDADLMRDS